MAFKRSTVRSRPSPPKQRSDFRFSVFYFTFLFQKGSNRQSISRGSPRRSARDIQSGICEANARGLPPRSRPSPPRQRSDFRFSVFYFTFLFQKGSNRQSISRGSPRRSARDIQSGICEANARGLPPRSRPSPPRQRSDFRFSVFYFTFLFQKGSNRQSISRGSPRRSARDIQSGICEANARGLPPRSRPFFRIRKLP